jgi:hypothetical protein
VKNRCNIPFERAKHFLSAGYKNLFLERISEEDIRLDILRRSFMKKCGFILKVSIFFIALLHLEMYYKNKLCTI